jgi:hypothetical protein
MDIIALVGFIGSGKDTVGRYLVEEHGFFDMAFADALKDTCAAIFCWDRVLLDGKNPQSREWRDQIDPWWAAKLDIPHFTPRWALQNVGTECLRKHFNNDLWISNVERRVWNLQSEHGGQAKVVLTDARFPNELKMIKSLGGRTFRVKRGPEPEWYSMADAANSDTFLHAPQAHDEMVKTGIHISEWAWIGFPVDATIENDSTLDALFARTEGLLK